MFKVLIDMASVVLACVQAFLCCKLFVSCVHSSWALVIIQCFLFCEYTKKSETLYFLSHFSFIFYVFLSYVSEMHPLYAFFFRNISGT